MTVPTQFRTRIDKRPGDLLGGVRRSIRVWLDRPGSIFLKPGNECGESRSDQFGRSDQLLTDVGPVELWATH